MSKEKRAVLGKLPGAKRIGKGQRWVVELEDGRRCLLKTNARDALMVRTSSGDTDAELSGFDDDVSHVLVVTGREGALSSWLVPIDIVEKQFRDNHKAWLDADPDHSRDNRTWVLRDLAKRFEGYEFEMEVASISPEEARRGLAAHFGTTPDNVHISIDV